MKFMRILPAFIFTLIAAPAYAISPDKLYEEGVEAFQSGDLKRAHTRFWQLVLETNPDTALHRQTQYNLARTLQKLKNHCSAVDRFDRYLELVEKAKDQHDKRLSRAQTSRAESARICAQTLEEDTRLIPSSAPTRGTDPFWDMVDRWFKLDATDGVLLRDDARQQAQGLRGRLGLAYGQRLTPRWALEFGGLVTPFEQGAARAYSLKGRLLYHLSPHLGLGIGLESLVETWATLVDVAVQLKAPLWSGWALCAEGALLAPLDAPRMLPAELRLGLRYAF